MAVPEFALFARYIAASARRRISPSGVGRCAGARPMEVLIRTVYPAVEMGAATASTSLRADHSSSAASTLGGVNNSANSSPPSRATSFAGSAASSRCAIAVEYLVADGMPQ